MLKRWTTGSLMKLSVHLAVSHALLQIIGAVKRTVLTVMRILKWSSLIAVNHVDGA